MSEEKRKSMRDQIPPEALEHMKAARDEMRKSMETILPPGFLGHRRAAGPAVGPCRVPYPPYAFPSPCDTMGRGHRSGGKGRGLASYVRPALFSRRKNQSRARRPRR